MVPINEIQGILSQGAPDKARVSELLAKAMEKKGLSYAEAGCLLQVEDSDHQAEILSAAGRIKEEIYGKRIVLFAPLYISNECSNNCLYCGFRRDNLSLDRRVLALTEAITEAGHIENMGHKRILLVCGETEDGNEAARTAEVVSAIYANTDIRRVNVNIAPLPVAEFRILKAAGIGTYQMFQETYNLEKYRYYHPSGPKADYSWRINAFDRAVRAGIDDFGMGVLFGLYDYRFEAMALISHASLLEQRLGVGPHTVSVPRLRPADGAVVGRTGYELTDRQLMLVTAVLRMALPYTGIILSTREPASLRDQLLKIGVSQVSAASSAAPGGYGSSRHGGTQFSLEDDRTLDEMVYDICKAGYLPSFCTACYRKERTGEKFMELAKGGDIKNLCQPNALLTFREYIEEYASPGTKIIGGELINRCLDSQEPGQVRDSLQHRMREIGKGKRDLFY